MICVLGTQLLFQSVGPGLLQG